MIRTSPIISKTNLICKTRKPTNVTTLIQKAGVFNPSSKMVSMYQLFEFEHHLASLLIQRINGIETNFSYVKYRIKELCHIANAKDSGIRCYLSPFQK